MHISWIKPRPFTAWDKSCEDCAIKRGFIKEVLGSPYPFMCVHRETEDGHQNVCAGWKEKLKEFNHDVRRREAQNEVGT